MPRNARFWRNVVLISFVHVAALIALLRWAGASKIESAPGITWLSNDNAEDLQMDSPEPEKNPTPEKSAAAEESPAVTAPAKSEIQLPAATPHPTASAIATPASSPTPRAKPSPKKKTAPKPTATPEQKKSKPRATPAKEKENAKKVGSEKKGKISVTKSAGTSAKSASAGNDTTQPGGSSGSTNADWYGNMLHDRFYREWAQPTTVVASGARLSALAKIRIEKDGRISDFKIVRSSGNVVVDESVEAVGKKVTRVDAVPAGLANGGHYDVNINFAFDSKER